MTWRPIHSTLVQDPDYRALSPSARALLIGIKLVLPPEGIGELYAEQLDELAGEPHAKALDELCARHWIRKHGRHVWLVNGFRWELSHRGRSLDRIRTRLVAQRPNPLIDACWKRYEDILGKLETHEHRKTS